MIKQKLCIVIVLVMGWAGDPARAEGPDGESDFEREIQRQENHDFEAPKPRADLEDDPPYSPPAPAADTAKEPTKSSPGEDAHSPKIEAPYERPESLDANYDGSERATSSSSGEPIFDWSKHKGETEVQHPFAPKGLIRVTKDLTYVYKTEEIEQTRAMTFKAGVFDPSRLSNPDEAGLPGANFSDNYAATSPALMLDYEWQKWRGALGKIGLRAGGGLFLVQGHGHFVGGVNAGLTPKEIFTFVTVPLNVGLVYRMNFGRRPMFVPYVEGGGTIFTFGELRDDNKAPKLGAAFGAYAAAGVGFNLTYFDAMSRIQLDREYGISAIFLTAEFRELIAFSRYDFTSPLINGGFCMEF